ncbi:unnamed protein product [Rotaria magnacalcarata]|uniref:Uncharacterized protein n=1 Tax=Rotaria magnacalcarata TaxID=392030 RepID=A0A816NSV4_9BILA|nr:unnamed protein product [Rotaria magnacalcarata]
MIFIVFKVVCAIIIVLELRTINLIYVQGHVGDYCRLQNRTFTLNICKTPPRLILPVCEGYCPSSSRWEFNYNRFVSRTSACTVTRYRVEDFVCRDSTHTSVKIIIPLACSCNKHYCQNSQ